MDRDGFVRQRGGVARSDAVFMEIVQTGVFTLTDEPKRTARAYPTETSTAGVYTLTLTPGARTQARVTVRNSIARFAQ